MVFYTPEGASVWVAPQSPTARMSGNFHSNVQRMEKEVVSHSVPGQTRCSVFLPTKSTFLLRKSTSNNKITSQLIEDCQMKCMVDLLVGNFVLVDQLVDQKSEQQVRSDTQITEDTQVSHYNVFTHCGPLSGTPAPTEI